MIQNTSVTTQEISHHYDELDEFYRKLWGTHLHHGLWDNPQDTKEAAAENLSWEVLSYLNPLEGKHLADIGCGYGETARMATQNGAKSVVAMTLSEKQLSYAQTHSKDLPITYIVGDWCQNKFESNSFDGAYSIECFSHVLDKGKFLREVYRTLRPGSKFVMTAWLASEWPKKWEKKYLLEPICREGRLHSLYNEEEVLNELEASGLTLFDFIDLSDKVWKTWLISSREVLKILKSKEGLKYLLDGKNQEKRFALSVLRILLGYKLGAFKYGLFVMYKDKGAEVLS